MMPNFVANAAQKGNLYLIRKKTLKKGINHEFKRKEKKRRRRKSHSLLVI